MKKDTKTATFVGGPLDGITKEVDKDLTVYKNDQPPLPEDIKSGEVSIGFFPPYHEYVYEETPIGSGTFVCR
jgi:hypothetical protein